MKTHLMLPLALLLAAAPAGFSQITSGPWTYKLSPSGATATILSYNGQGGTVVIPAMLDGKPVVAVGDIDSIFSNENTSASVTDLVIPAGIAKIGWRAFEYCPNLKTVSMGSVSIIGYGAFESCEKLTSVSLPRTLRIIEAQAFRGCDALESIVLPEQVRLAALDGDSSIFETTFSRNTVLYFGKGPKK